MFLWLENVPGFSGNVICEQVVRHTQSVLVVGMTAVDVYSLGRLIVYRTVTIDT